MGQLVLPRGDVHEQMTLNHRVPEPEIKLNYYMNVAKHNAEARSHICGEVLNK